MRSRPNDKWTPSSPLVCVLLYTSLCGGLWGCDDDSEPRDETAGETAAGVTAAGERTAGMMSSGADEGGAEGGEESMLAETCGPDGPSRLYAVVELRFAAPADGVSPGFDLDDSSGAPDEERGCGKPDYQTEEGAPGIDNQFSDLLPVIDPLVNRPVNDALAETISEGRLILLIEVEGIDDLERDDCVNVNIYRADEGALFGGDGLLLAGQSYALDLTQPWSRAEGGQVREGRVITPPFDFTLPLNFFGEEVDVSLARTRLSLSLDPSAPGGVLAGGLMIDPFVEEVAMIAQDFILVARNLLTSKADLLPNADGRCQAISTVWTLSARSGYLYRDTPRPEAGPTDFSGATP